MRNAGEEAATRDAPRCWSSFRLAIGANQKSPWIADGIYGDLMGSVDVAGGYSKLDPFQSRLGQETIRQIAARYESGEPSTALMSAFGLSKGSVLKVLREAGVVMRNQGLSDEQIKEAEQLYTAAWSLARIGEKFGVDHTVVRR